MQLTDILELSCIKIPIQATEKYQAITELMDLLAQNGKLGDYHTALQAVLDREAVRSTGVGQGFAIPHGKTSAVQQLVMAIGKVDQPIDFDSIDGQPVTVNCQWRKVVSRIGISEVRGLLQKGRPRRDPVPELLLFVRMEFQVAGA